MAIICLAFYALFWLSEHNKTVNTICGNVVNTNDMQPYDVSTATDVYDNVDDDKELDDELCEDGAMFTPLDVEMLSEEQRVTWHKLVDKSNKTQEIQISAAEMKVDTPSSKRVRAQQLEPLINALRDWAKSYNEWVHMIGKSYDDAHWINDQQNTEMYEEFVSHPLYHELDEIKYLDAEIVEVAVLESCRNPRSCNFQYTGDSMSRETVYGIVMEILEHGYPIRQERCSVCNS